MISFKAGLTLAALAFGAEAYAQDVFKCQVNGKTVYQQSRCSDQEIKGDAPWDRQRTRAEAEEKAYQARLLKEKTDAKERINTLRTCKTPSSSCAAAYFTGYVAGLSQNDLIAALGEPDNTQKIGRDTFWYYNLFLQDFSTVKLRRVQFTFIGTTVERANY